MNNPQIELDVLCVGRINFDIVMGVDHHPRKNEKCFANRMAACGGGPAANAAVTVSRLGLKSAILGTVGDDVYGRLIIDEFKGDKVETEYVFTGSYPTSVSTILVKPDGNRSVINYKEETCALSSSHADTIVHQPKVILFDGHEPEVSVAIMNHFNSDNVVTVLDAGSIHKGTQVLSGRVDHVVASEKFALEYSGEPSIEKAINKLGQSIPSLVVTLGDRGLCWKNGAGSGNLPAFQISPMDTTGAGDAFHGAFATGMVMGLDWEELLRFSSAVGALTCTGWGGRPAIPFLEDVEKFLR